VKFHLEHTFVAPLDAVEAAMVNPTFLEGSPTSARRRC